MNILTKLFRRTFDLEEMLRHSHEGFTVCYVDEHNDLHLTGDGTKPEGWDQTVFEHKHQAVAYEQKLLEQEGGVWEVVKCRIQFIRFKEGD